MIVFFHFSASSGKAASLSREKCTKAATPIMSTPKSTKKKQKYVDSPHELDSALAYYLKAVSKTKERVSAEKSETDYFFESCSTRIKKFPPSTQSYLQLQIQQLFLNAEHPQLTPVPITPLPSHSMMAEITYFPENFRASTSNSTPSSHVMSQPPVVPFNSCSTNM